MLLAVWFIGFAATNIILMTGPRHKDELPIVFTIGAILVGFVSALWFIAWPVHFAAKAYARREMRNRPITG